MKKMYKVFKIVSVTCISIIFLVSLSLFIYHKIQLHKESAIISNDGTFVKFHNKKMNVYHEGNGDNTYVFMSGSGIAAPVYEMKGLYSKFSKDNRIAVVERAGYGYSDVFHDDRDIDTILHQTRKALSKSGNKPPYILVPHSLSGLEAVYWAQKYPDEVKAIIALDIGLPKEYANNPLRFTDVLTIKGMNLLTKMGFYRLAPSAAYDPEVIRQSFLTEHEKEIFKALSYKQMFNDNMEQEILQSPLNGKKSVKLPMPKETPILFLSAYTKDNKHSKYTKQKNKNYKEFAEQLLISDVKKIKGKHSIHLYAPDEIYNLSIDFIREKVERNNDERSLE